jgi:hypothetical protein
MGEPKQAVDTPALLIDVPTMDRNIARMTETELLWVQWRVGGLDSRGFSSLAKASRRSPKPWWRPGLCEQHWRFQHAIRAETLAVLPLNCPAKTASSADRWREQSLHPT